MAELHNLSVYCELANFIAGCRSEACIELRFDSETGEYAVSGAACAPLGEMYANENLFFKRMRPFIEARYDGEFGIEKREEGVFRVSPWVLETLYQSTGLLPYRGKLALIRHVQLEQLCAAGYVKSGTMVSSTGIPNIPFAIIQVNSDTLRRHKKAFKRMFRRCGECVHIHFAPGGAPARVFE